MGWTVTRKPASVGDYLKRELLVWDYQREDMTRTTGECLAFAIKGMTAFAIGRSTRYNLAGEVEKTEKYLVVVLLRYWSNGEFGFKDMTADMGPVEHNCPRSILRQVDWPSRNNYEREWRKAAWYSALKLDPTDQAKATYNKVKRLLRGGKRAEALEVAAVWNASEMAKKSGYRLNFGA